MADGRSLLLSFTNVHSRGFMDKLILSFYIFYKFTYPNNECWNRLMLDLYGEIEQTKKLILIFTSRKWRIQDKFHYRCHILIYSEEENHVMTSESCTFWSFSYQSKNRKKYFKNTNYDAGPHKLYYFSYLIYSSA